MNKKSTPLKTTSAIQNCFFLSIWNDGEEVFSRKENANDWQMLSKLLRNFSANHIQIRFKNVFIMYVSRDNMFVKNKTEQ